MKRDFEQRRRSIRLPEFDYKQPGAYFVTICAYKRRQSFGEIKHGQIRHTGLGQLAADCWTKIPSHHCNIILDAFVVMPNHMHGILMVDPIRRGTIYRAPTRKEQFGSPVKGSIPTIIRTYKAAVTRNWRKMIRDSSFTVWQHNYYERVIRNDLELNKLRRYIIHNPQRWELDRYYSPT